MYAFITGSTNSYDFPVTDGSQLQVPTRPDGTQVDESINNAFLFELTADGSAPQYSTYIGRGHWGEGTLDYQGNLISYNFNETDQIGTDVAVDSSQTAYVTGYTDGIQAIGIPIGVDFPGDYFHIADAWIHPADLVAIGAATADEVGASA